MQSLQGPDAEIPEQPLLHPIDEELLEEQEVREGSVIERTERVQCTVALAKASTCLAIWTAPRQAQHRS